MKILFSASSSLLATILLSLSFSFAPLAKSEEMTIAAAASLQDALAEMKGEIEKELPGTTLRISTGSSGMLQQQIIQGAPIDIFLSAAKRPIEELERRNLLSVGSSQEFLSGQLVLIAPKSSRLKSIRELETASVKRIGIGETRSVPAGEYAVQALTALKLIEAVRPKFLYAKDVRQVLSYVERGEIDAGIVYKSDLKSKAAQELKLIEIFPESSHTKIIYSMAVVAASRKQVLGKKVLNYFESRKASLIWNKFGFDPLTRDSAAVEKDHSRAPK